MASTTTTSSSSSSSSTSKDTSKKVDESLEKAKQLGGQFLSITKTNFARAQHMAMSAVNKSGETVDVTFEQTKEQVETHRSHIKKLDDDIKKLQHIATELSNIQAVIAADFIELVDSHSQFYNATLKNQDAARINDSARLGLEEYLKKDFNAAVGNYMQQFKTLKERTEIDTTRRVDMDRYFKDVNKEKGTAAAKAAESKYEVAKENYLALHNELQQDFQNLLEDRGPFFDPLVATYFIALNDFYRSCAKSSADVIPLIGSINRAAILTHPPVVTPFDNSSVNPKNIVQPSPLLMSSSSAPSHTPTHQPAQIQTTSHVHTAATVHTGAPAVNVVQTVVPPPSHKPTHPKAKGLFDFNATDSDELSFRVNDILVILDNTGEWWRASLNGKEGLIPANYVQLI